MHGNSHCLIFSCRILINELRNLMMNFKMMVQNTLGPLIVSRMTRADIRRPMLLQLRQSLDVIRKTTNECGVLVHSIAASD
jgi:hypothetical protein